MWLKNSCSNVISLQELKFDMTAKTSFDEFATVVCEDKRSSSLDAGNVKLAYNSLLEKVRIKILSNRP